MDRSEKGQTHLHNMIPVTEQNCSVARRRGLVVSSLPATEEIGAMGCEIESHQGIGG
jgi:hypothetical protein